MSNDVSKTQKRFHNPYHFVPVAPPPEATTTPIHYYNPQKKIYDEPTETRHDIFHSTSRDDASIFSGRIVSTITNITSLVIGGVHEQNKKDYTTIKPFTLGSQLAIPGSSIRGLISSVAEAASSSALRVLDTTSCLSFRKEYSQRLSKKEHEGKLIHVSESVNPCANLSSSELRVRPIGQDKADTDYEVPMSVLKKFQRLADERTKATTDKHGNIIPGTEPLPFIRNTRKESRNSNPEELKQRVVPHSGQTVLYRLDSTNSYVEEISFSEVWRDRLETHKKEADISDPDYLSQTGQGELFERLSPELLPISAKSPRKTAVTLCEKVFGFSGASAINPGDSIGLQGRVRFSNALPAESTSPPVLDEPVKLKILASPKPPSPPFYLQDANSRDQSAPIPKKAWNKKDTRFTPLGRKFYLHDKNANHTQSWRTLRPNENKDQKGIVTPIKPGATFQFSIEFENLSRIELGMLLYALEPEESYHHKLGLGKPIGLGSVKIRISELQLLDRAARYKIDNPFRASRYSRSWAAADIDRNTQTSDTGSAGETRVLPTAFIHRLKSEFLTSAGGTNSPHIHALNLIGNLSASSKPIHYPQLEALSGAELEDQTYMWFVENNYKIEKRRYPRIGDPEHQRLIPISLDDTSIQTLERHARLYQFAIMKELNVADDVIRFIIKAFGKTSCRTASVGNFKDIIKDAHSAHKIPVLIVSKGFSYNTPKEIQNIDFEIIHSPDANDGRDLFNQLFDLMNVPAEERPRVRDKHTNQSRPDKHRRKQS